ncbi:hypothetical protein GJ496_004213 [Pomphorhynchus laevis]|nr:hypothetical protein GJ496_004213 [Pomphorhynchus laevis]
MRHRSRIFGLSENISDSSRKLLRVRVFGASDLIILQNVGRRGAVIDFAKTRIIPKTINPQWNEEFLFWVNPEKHRLLCEVYDNNRLIKDDFFGQIAIKLNSDIITEMSEEAIEDEHNICVHNFKLQKKAVFNRVRGQLILNLSYLQPNNQALVQQDEQTQIDSTLQQDTSDHPNLSELPPAWKARLDSNGREYYIDHNNRITTWDRPTPGGSSTTITNATTSAGTIPASNEVALPPTWQISYTSRGRMFFINHNERKTTWIDPRTGLPSLVQARQDTEHDLGTLPPGWEIRIHNDRTLFIDHNRKRTQWEDPRLEKYVGPSVPFSPRFEEKLKFFRRSLPRPKSYVGSQVELHVSRTNILESSFRAVMPFRDPEYLKARLWVIFDGEKGLDYGGVAREWFHLLAKELFNPGYGLFVYSSMDNYTLQVNPLSGLVNEEHLRYFMFVGRVVGMAIYHNKLIDAFFVPPFYKMMLERPVSLSDLETVDRDYYNSLKYILDNDPKNLDIYFSVNEDVFGETQEYDLISNGRNVPVTQENKRDFINKVMEWRLSGRIKNQMDHFMFGFNEIIPKDDIKLFDAKELELLISGIGEINVSDWRKHTLYKGEYNVNHPVIQLFWRAVLSMDNEARIRLLQFATGTSRLPMNGFHELWGSNGPQWFTIEKWGDVSKLPRSHTCFNRIDLPPYTNYQELREKLITAVDMSEGFEGVD